MGKLNIFDIVYTNLNGLLEPGDLMIGHVHVELLTEMKLRGIRIVFHGSAFVRWTERHTSGKGKKRRTINKVFSAGETYFNHAQVLFGRAEGEEGEDLILQPGKHIYPFKFQLPNSLPSSFESNLHGHVRYWSKAYIDRPWRFDKTTKQPFSVISKLDLNEVSDATRSQYGQAYKTLCCMCCESGPVSAVFRLPRAGFVPGENVIPDAEVINNSNRPMASSKIELIQIISFHAVKKSRRVTRTIVEAKQGEILAGDTSIWKDIKLHIPPIPPSGLVGCRIIDIDYRIKMVVDPSGPSFTLDIPLNLIIGTTPLEGTYSGDPPPLKNKLVYHPAGEKTPIPHIQTIQIPPPTHGECVFGKVDIRDDDDNDFTMGEFKFAPVYYYYVWNKLAKPLTVL